MELSHKIPFRRNIFGMNGVPNGVLLYCKLKQQQNHLDKLCFVLRGTLYFVFCILIMSRNPKRAAAFSKKRSASSASSTKRPVATAEQLVEQGNIALTRLEPELASKFFSNALELAPNDTLIMDSLADVFIQLGENEKAYNLLLKSASDEPTTNPVKWLYLAQLQQGHDALKCYQTGIGLLEASIDTTKPPDANLINQICKAYCSVAELYLSDLWCVLG